MSDEHTLPDDAMPDELSLLKQRARNMGIPISNNIGLETLRERIRAKMEGEASPSEDEPKSERNPLSSLPPGTGKMSITKYLEAEQLRLVRCRITCMDPKKKDLNGEVITVANRYLGNIKKFVPFGEATDNGYHIPYCIYKMLERRRFLNIRTTKDKRTGLDKVEYNYAREFAIEVLPQLSVEELKDLANAQLAAGAVA